MNTAPIPPKQTLYKTAYSYLHRCYVTVKAIGKDDKGSWFYACSNDYEGIVPFTAAEDELSNFVF